MRLLALLPLFLSLSSSSVALPTGPRGTSSGNIVTVNTQFGQAKGVAVGDGSVVRFVAKYATAARFGNPVPATKWIGLYVSLRVFTAIIAGMIALVTYLGIG